MYELIAKSGFYKNEEGDCEMVQVRRKITILRVLQVVFYALGFPLFLHMVMLANKSTADSLVVNNGYLALIIAAALWVVVILAQLLFRAICRKNRMSRAVMVALIAFIITVAPIVYSDFVLKGQYDELVAKYIELGLSEGDFSNYEDQLTNYASYAEEMNAEIEEYVTLYNLEIEAFEGKTYSAVNTDGTESELDEEAQAWYSPNGMFGDGYLFSFKQALAVQEAYYSNKLAFAAEGRDIDVELADAILALKSNANSDWNKYKAGADESSFNMEGFEYVASSDEYELAYGEDGTATKYYVTEARLDTILGVLGSTLGANSDINSLLGLLGGLLPPGLDINALLSENLSVDQLLGVVNGLGLGATLAGLLGNTGATELTKADLFNLLEGYSNYQSPTTYPVFYFLEDEALREYAYANYYANIHGGKLGAVLVGDYVGLKNLDNMTGVANKYTGEQLLNKKLYWEFQTELLNNFYPIFSVRAMCLKMSAAIVFCLIAAYFFTAKIDEQYAKLKLKKGGNK
ncbi:MAG: hypothetical protein J6V83_01185 [Clostridia bacterium]|nr:hypothetical protein [Clostridia bacterium]